MFSRILVPHDFSPHSDAALASARSLAAAVGGEVRILHVAPPPQAFPAGLELSVSEEWSDEWSSKARGLLEKAVREVSDHRIQASSELVEDGSVVAEAIADSASRWDASVIVMGSHGYSGLEVGLLGSTTEKIVGIASIPVLTVKADHALGDSLQQILVPTDFSGESRQAVAVAGKLARAYGAEVELLHVYEHVPPAFLDIPIPNHDREKIREAARQEIHNEMKSLEEQGVKTSFQVTVGNAAREIVERAESNASGLIVMGTRGRTRFRKLLLGSVATRVARYAHCPVLTCGADA